MATKLGYSPTSMTLALVSGADFVTTLRSKSGDWPATAVISIEVGTATWTATLVTNEARFDVDAAAVDAAIAEAPKRFRLWYTDGPTRLLWGAGPVLISNG